jgi:hypothetical protein
MGYSRSGKIPNNSPIILQRWVYFLAWDSMNISPSTILKS